ncbi:MAG: LD-carboxypeptidase [Tissierellia bacterium]|nr:LD-carboxypeptidase [Tissierellia bacterium]
MARYPKKLAPGATIGLVCMSSPIPRKAVDHCKETLEALGYGVKLAGNLSTVYGGYMAGTGEERARWIRDMFLDPQVEAIFCVRGGDGGSRIMDLLDFDELRAHPKIFMGYSDVTSLHLALNQECDLVSFHGPMVYSNMLGGMDPDTQAGLFRALTAQGDFPFVNPPEEPLRVLKKGQAQGQLVGGNLALLSASLGTAYEVNTQGKILFIEDVDEGIHRLERYACQLKNAGKYEAAAGILLGQFTDCKNTTMVEYDEIRLFEDLLRDYDIPVMYNLQSGHGDKIITLPLGASCTMDTETKTIKFACQR